MKKSIAKIRQEYQSPPLQEEELLEDPLKQFSRWLSEAIKAALLEPNAMTLATVSQQGHPSARTVLLKEVEPKGFVFYTDSRSRKGEQLQGNPHAALVFWWRELYRQVSIEGKVHKVARQRARAYFAKRPRGAQLAALASEQSTPLASRAEIEETFERLKQKYRGKEIPCPRSWEGYCLNPERLELWQGRENRLHDRFLYVKANGRWLLSRLAP